MGNFWHELEKPLWALAPMEDVTDTVFREIVLKLSTPSHLHLLFSEFLSTDGFCHDIGHDKVIHRIKANSSELDLARQQNVKLVAQIWGTDPEKFFKTARYIAAHTPFHGIDINMGCPMKNIIKKGACSALINTPQLALDIIAAVKEATSLPLSVKTRIGFKKVVTEEWISTLLQSDIDALIVHGRIQKMMSEGEADWNEIQKAVELRNQINPTIKILGNGDVASLKDGHEKVKTHGVDGAMIGRGIFSNPWFFSPGKEPSQEEKLQALLDHARLYENTWQSQKPWAIIKRFFKIYTNNFPAAAKLRAQLMDTNNYTEAEQVVSQFNEWQKNFAQETTE
ncbi:tRNA-dihydrouridine synthase [Marinilabiliaceae bacterium JC017]|nr:tRNA-dihydrouridine synthase [Marinilabiliaceae bacterium JC017]